MHSVLLCAAALVAVCRPDSNGDDVSGGSVGGGGGGGSRQLGASDEDIYVLTDDWYTRHAATWLQALGHLSGKPAAGLEIGAFQGMSAVWFLLHVLDHPASTITCVDPFLLERPQLMTVSDGSPMSLWSMYVFNTNRYGKKVVTHRGSSQFILRVLLPVPTYDFVYIDGDHRAPAVLEDAILAFRLLKVGGIMLFDDYELGGTDVRRQDHPGVAVDAFLAVFVDHVEVIHKGYQVHVKKVKSDL